MRIHRIQKGCIFVYISTPQRCNPKITKVAHNVTCFSSKRYVGRYVAKKSFYFLAQMSGLATRTYLQKPVSCKCMGQNAKIILLKGVSHEN